MKKKKTIRREHKYSAICKVGYDTNLKQPICVKYRITKMDNFLEFIQKKFPQVAWINIFTRSDKKLAFTWGNQKGLKEGY